MSKARVAVLKVVTKELTVTAAAARYGYSRQHLHRLLARYRTGGLDAVDPQPRRPLTHPHATSDLIRGRIVELRLQLTQDGLDAGPVTIAWHVIELHTGEILSTHDIDPTRTYWRNTQKAPGRWPGAQ